MAEVTGKLITCDRCGTTHFLRCIDEGEADGGYTRWNKFEDFPEGWQLHYDVGWLCPKCNTIYQNLIKSFMNNEVITVTSTAKTATSGYACVSNSTRCDGRYVLED